MFKRNLVYMIFGGAIGVAVSTAAVAATPAMPTPSPATIASPSNPSIERAAYWYRGGYYPYRWHGNYWRHRRWGGGGWRYW
jgi:hypothetical protein